MESDHNLTNRNLCLKPHRHRSRDASYNDLDITGNVTIVGDGAGATIIDSFGMLSSADERVFELTMANSKLDLSRVTLTGGASVSSAEGTAIRANVGSELVLTDSAVVNHDSAYDSAIYVNSTIATMRGNVFAKNDGFYTFGPAVTVISTSKRASSFAE